MPGQHANTAVPSNEDIENIELLHLVDLDRCFGLNLFPCPPEEVYPVQECNGVKRYLDPHATHRNYGYFKAVKTTQLIASLKQQFGPDIAHCVMKRYLAFSYEFAAFCWSERLYNLEAQEYQVREYCLNFDIIELAFCIERSAHQDLFVRLQSIAFMNRNIEGRSKRKKIAIQQWKFFGRLATIYPTKWKYHHKDGSPSNLYQYNPDFPDANPWTETPSSQVHSSASHHKSNQESA